MIDPQFEKEAREALPPLAHLDEEAAAKVIELWQMLVAESEWSNINECPYRPDVTGVSLAQHSAAVADGALRLLETNDQYSAGQVTWDKQLTIMAGICHDVSKLVEYEPDGNGSSRHSHLGNTLQHAMYAMHLMLNLDFPWEAVTIVAHHTPQSKWPPASPEAIAIVYADHALYDFYNHLNDIPLLMH